MAHPDEVAKTISCDVNGTTVMLAALNGFSLLTFPSTILLAARK